ncbi:MAG: hypothetical protein ACOCVM_01225 [Desulfovibrionaceae bacterium]
MTFRKVARFLPLAVLLTLLLSLPAQASSLDQMIQKECEKTLQEEGLDTSLTPVCVAAVKEQLGMNRPAANLKCPAGTYPIHIEGHGMVCATISSANVSCPPGQKLIYIDTGKDMLPMCVTIKNP